MMSREKQSRKRKRSTNHRVATMETGATTVEWLKPVTLASPAIATSTMTPFFGVADVSFGLGVMILDPLVKAGMGPVMEARASNQPIEVGVDLDIKTMTGDQPMEANAGFNVGVMTSDLLIEASVGLNIEVRADNQPIKTGASPDVEVRAGG